MNFVLSAAAKKKNVVIELAIIETIRLQNCARNGKNYVCTWTHRMSATDVR